MRSNTGRPSAVIVFRTFRPSWTSVICLEKLRDLSLGPMTLFQRPICVSIRLRWLYPVAVCQAMHPLLRIWAIWRSRDLVAWIIPKNILSLVFSTLGVV